ncbi:unnamed protein product [Schistosoma spindalis]|nr:unnamed protein product [Schistosoma spindale]
MSVKRYKETIIIFTAYKQLKVIIHLNRQLQTKLHTENRQNTISIPLNNTPKISLSQKAVLVIRKHSYMSSIYGFPPVAFLGSLPVLIPVKDEGWAQVQQP